LIKQVGKVATDIANFKWKWIPVVLNSPPSTAPPLDMDWLYPTPYHIVTFQQLDRSRHVCDNLKNFLFTKDSLLMFSHVYFILQADWQVLHIDLYAIQTEIIEW